jgi:putative tryptophan/tyrosine transport system substrate-binding protein
VTKGGEAYKMPRLRRHPPTQLSVVTRRAFVVFVTGACVLVRRTVRAQQASKVYHIGYLHPATSSDPGQAFQALRQALANMGYESGRNITFMERWGNGKLETLPSLAAELVALKVDVIVAVSPSAIRAAHDATRTIPIVMAFSGDDPVKAGFVSSLARPGGNVTGMTSITSELAPKWIELLQEVVPGIRRVAVMRSPIRRDHTEQVDVLRAAAQSGGIQLQVLDVVGLQDYGAAFDAMSRQHAQGVVILSGPEFAQNVKPLAELALLHRLPSIWQYREFAAAGGLLTYGPSIPLLSAQAAVFVDKILKGANPAELSVQQPTKFDLAINLKTAMALGLRISQSLRLRADEVIR